MTLIPTSLLPDIHATVRERLVFNFAIPLGPARRLLPKDWLVPQEVREGVALLSFCVLDLGQVTIKPWPAKVGVSGLHCAHRLAVIDHSGDPPCPAVFVPERLTGSRLGAAVTHLGFPGRHRYVSIRVSPPATRRTVEVIDGGESVFFAEIEDAPETPFESRVFSGREDFESLLRAGARSWAPAVEPGTLNCVDLAKEENPFSPLRVLSVRDSLVESLVGGPAAPCLDSLLRTEGVRYTWKYRGQRA